MLLSRLARPPLLAAVLLLYPAIALAWWNEDWTQRTRVTLDTTAQGVPIGETVGDVALPIRLHSGNFDFVNAREDGSDLRVLAADDRTELPWRIERFDGVNELAVLWVRVPTVVPDSDRNVLHVYAGNRAAASVSPGDVYDPATLAAVSFDDVAAAGADTRGRWRASTRITPEPAAVLAGGARLAGDALVWEAAEPVRIAAGGALTLSVWFRADSADAATLIEWGPLSLRLRDGRFEASVGASALAGGGWRVATWTHVALTVGTGRARLFVDGAEVADAIAATPAIDAPLRLGQGMRGAADELQISDVVRTPAWIALTASVQGADGRMVRSVRDEPTRASLIDSNLVLLIENLTTTAWAVLVSLAFLFALAAWVMASKLRYIGRSDRANRAFLGQFRVAGDELLRIGHSDGHAHSSLYRLYRSGLAELTKRGIGEAGARLLSGPSLDAVRATVDADMVRESHRLNAQMVWLTIAISGGPFLGLLGTVVGVTITFAAIAAAGDVNVNAIAPGVAAALLTTVAGLAVAIPALFGYNYLATRIRNISADMQIFVDEFVTRVAERYGSQ